MFAANKNMVRSSPLCKKKQQLQQLCVILHLTVCKIRFMPMLYLVTSFVVQIRAHALIETCAENQPLRAYLQPLDTRLV